MYISNYISSSILHLYSTIEKKYWVKWFSCVWLFATPWTVAYQAPLFMGFSKQEYWSGLPLPSPGGKIGFTNWAKLDHIPTSDQTCLGLLPDYTEAVEEWRCFMDCSRPLSTLYSSLELREGVGPAKPGIYREKIQGPLQCGTKFWPDVEDLTLANYLRNFCQVFWSDSSIVLIPFIPFTEDFFFFFRTKLLLGFWLHFWEFFFLLFFLENSNLVHATSFQNQK